MSKIRFWVNMSELGAGTRGARTAFEELVKTASAQISTIFSDYPVEEIENCNYLFDKGEFNVFVKRIDGMITMYNRICDSLSTSAEFPVIISGDHSLAGGTIAGLRKANPDKRIGVIWIDAHADIHTPYTSHSGNIHGMPVACMLSEDNIENKYREIDEEAIRSWNILKSIGGKEPNIHYSDIVQYCVRDTEPEEDFLINEHGIKAFSVQDIRDVGAAVCAAKGLKYLKNHDLIYISFDVDAMDPKVSSATGTPVDSGITSLEAEELILTLMEDPRICCFEITEINPMLETKGNVMVETSLGILEKVVSKLENRDEY